MQQLSTEVVDDLAEYFQNVSETAEHIRFTISENTKLTYHNYQSIRSRSQHSHPTGESTAQIKNPGACSPRRNCTPRLQSHNERTALRSSRHRTSN